MEHGLIQPSLFAPAFHNDLNYRHLIARINSGYDPATPCKNLVSFGSVIAQITWLICVPYTCTASKFGLFIYIRRTGIPKRVE